MQDEYLAFTVQGEYDRDNASDGISRYGAYISQRWRSIQEAWEDEGISRVIHFAAVVWNIAMPPVMTPGYLKNHQRVKDSFLYRNEEDNSLIAHVTLMTGWPAALEKSRDWQGDRRWRDGLSYGRGDIGYYVPSDKDVSAAPHVACMAEVVSTINMQDLPELPPEFDSRVVPDLARQFIDVLASEVNAFASPVIRALETR